MVATKLLALKSRHHPVFQVIIIVIVLLTSLGHSVLAPASNNLEKPFSTKVKVIIHMLCHSLVAFLVKNPIDLDLSDEIDPVRWKRTRLHICHHDAHYYVIISQNTSVPVIGHLELASRLRHMHHGCGFRNFCHEVRFFSDLDLIMNAEHFAWIDRIDWIFWYTVPSVLWHCCWMPGRASDLRSFCFKIHWDISIGLCSELGGWRIEVWWAKVGVEILGEGQLANMGPRDCW